MKKSSTMSEIQYDLVDVLLTKSENYEQYHQIFRERRIHDKVIKFLSETSLVKIFGDDIGGLTLLRKEISLMSTTNNSSQESVTTDSAQSSSQSSTDSTQSIEVIEISEVNGKKRYNIDDSKEIRKFRFDPDQNGYHGQIRPYFHDFHNAADDFVNYLGNYV